VVEVSGGDMTIGSPDGLDANQRGRMEAIGIAAALGTVSGEVAAQERAKVRGGATSLHVTPAIARGVLWFFGQPQGREPGHFTQSLLEAISRADTENRDKLAAAFPGHVEAFRMGAEETYGVNRLVEIEGAE
jgi:hypothetical protein